jgi:hypothetical protein
MGGANNISLAANDGLSRVRGSDQGVADLGNQTVDVGAKIAKNHVREIHNDRNTHTS